MLLFLRSQYQISILGPLLLLADCFLPPFKIHAEKTIELSDELEDGVVLRGQLHIVLIKHSFWVMAIEPKRPTYSIEAGLPQLIYYLIQTGIFPAMG